MCESGSSFINFDKNFAEETENTEPRTKSSPKVNFSLKKVNVKAQNGEREEESKRFGQF